MNVPDNIMNPVKIYFMLKKNNVKYTLVNFTGIIIIINI